MVAAKLLHDRSTETTGYVSTSGRCLTWRFENAMVQPRGPIDRNLEGSVQDEYSKKRTLG